MPLLGTIMSAFGHSGVARGAAGSKAGVLGPSHLLSGGPAPVKPMSAWKNQRGSGSAKERQKEHMLGLSSALLERFMELEYKLELELQQQKTRAKGSGHQLAGAPAIPKALNSDATSR